MNKTEIKNFECLPLLLRRRLEKEKKTSTEIKKELCILKYSSPVKLKAVVRWKERMARHGITTKRLAMHIGLPDTRISEYLNFTKEPKEGIFQDIELALYEMGA
mgnify:CR=1 FL=1